MDSAILAILSKDFPTEEAQAACHERCLNKFLKGQINRLFDDFHHVVSEEVLADFVLEFQNVFDAIKPTYHDDDEINKLTYHDKKSIYRWVKKLEKLGCDNLFDPVQKIIDPELLRFLGLEQFAQQINRADLLCAYVLSFTQQMLLEPVVVQKRVDKPPIFFSIFAYVTANYRQWALEEMKLHHIRSNDNIIKPGQPTPLFTPVIKKSAIGLGVFGAVMGIGLTFIKAYQMLNKEEEPVRKHKFMP